METSAQFGIVSAPATANSGRDGTTALAAKTCGGVLVRLSPSERPISRPSPFAAPERYRTLYRVVCVLYGPEGQGHFMVLPRSRASPRGSLSGGYSPNSYFTSQRSDEASLHNPFPAPGPGVGTALAHVGLPAAVEGGHGVARGLLMARRHRVTKYWRAPGAAPSEASPAPTTPTCVEPAHAELERVAGFVETWDSDIIAEDMSTRARKRPALPDDEHVTRTP